MNILNVRLALLATTMLTGALPFLPAENAAAQQAQTSEGTVLETITVTARKREEDIRKVPVSVDVETKESLEKKRIIDGTSALRDVSGASLGTFGDRSNAFTVIRGVAPILSPLSPDDSSVLTFMDGMPLPIGGSLSSYIDLERVEVLKGPQNTLFGRNTSGGAINLVPAEPTHGFSGMLLGEWGTDGIYRTEAMVNGSILPDTLAGRIAIRRSGSGGYIKNIAGESLGGDESWAGRASLLFTPTDDTRWLVSLQGEDARTSPTTYIAYRPGGPKIAAQNHTSDDYWLFGLNSRFEHDFETMTFISQTGYSRIDDSNDYNYPDAMIASDFSGLPPIDFLDPTTNFIDWRKRDARLSQELRLRSATGSSFDWQAGVSFYRDTADRNRTSEMWYFGPSATGTMTYDLATTGQSVFADISYPVVEGLKLSAGVRATHESKRFSGEYFSDGLSGAVPYFAESGKESYNFLTGRLALSYEWTPDIMTYASISRGYKSGGFPLGNSLMWSGTARNPYDSSTVISYEAGLRAALFDDSLMVNGALFFNDMKKEQMQTWDYATFTGSNLNLDAQSAGFELDVRYLLTHNWSLMGGGAYTFSELRNVSAAASAAQDGLANGNRLPTVPEWTARAAIEYSAEGADIGFGGMLADKTFSARLGYNYIGERFTDASNFGKLEAAHVVSAKLGVDWGTGEAYIFGDNLLNKEYTTIKERFGTDASGAPVFGVSYARGATVGAGVSLRF